MTTAVLVQILEGNLRIFADWVREGEPVKRPPTIYEESPVVTSWLAERTRMRYTSVSFSICAIVLQTAKQRSLCGLKTPRKSDPFQLVRLLLLQADAAALSDYGAGC